MSSWEKLGNMLGVGGGGASKGSKQQAAAAASDRVPPKAAQPGASFSRPPRSLTAAGFDFDDSAPLPGARAPNQFKNMKRVGDQRESKQPCVHRPPA